jgi:hypothetical protein
MEKQEEILWILVILIFWTSAWMFYNFQIRPHYQPNPLLNDPLTKFKIELPSHFKCHIKNVSSRPENNDCNNEDIDGWTIGHLAIYFTIGLFVKDVEWYVLAISYACEIWEFVAGWRARWILDPLTNFSGYILGRMVSRYFEFKPPELVVDNYKIAILVALLMVQLHFCHPSKMNLTSSTI